MKPNVDSTNTTVNVVISTAERCSMCRGHLCGLDGARYGAYLGATSVKFYTNCVAAALHHPSKGAENHYLSQLKDTIEYHESRVDGISRRKPSFVITADELVLTKMETKSHPWTSLVVLEVIVHVIETVTAQLNTTYPSTSVSQITAPSVPQDRLTTQWPDSALGNSRSATWAISDSTSLCSEEVHLRSKRQSLRQLLDPGVLLLMIRTYFEPIKLTA